MMMTILTFVAWVWGVIWCRVVTMYHCWRCLHMIIVSLDNFCQIISPPLPIIRKRYSGGRILLGLVLSVKTLKTPMDTTRLLAFFSATLISSSLGLRSPTHKSLPIIWILVTMTSFYGRRCRLNHVGMSMSGMSALAVLSLLGMSRVCSVPCLETNQT